MGSNTPSEYLKKITSSVLNDSWMNELYSSKKTEQQEQLKKIFTAVSDNNVSAAEKAQLLTQAETLQDKVERLEAKMAVLVEELSKNEEIIAKHADDITDLISSAEKKSEEMEDNHRSLVKRAVDDVFYMYQKGEIGKDAIAPEIRRRIEANNMSMRYQGQLNQILGKLSSKESEVSNLANEAARWMDQRKILESQYGSTKSAYELLTKSLGQIGTTDTNFTNSDNDTNAPVYSLAKVDITSSLIEQYSTPPTNTAQQEGSSTPDTTALNSKYSQYFSSALTGSDSERYDDDAVAKLGAALNEGLINDLMSSGLDSKGVSDFLVDNFAGAHLVYDTQGNLSIPNGNSSETTAVFNQLSQALSNKTTTFLGANDTWSEAGNTIDSNAQIAALKTFMENGGFQQLGEGDPKFTFKEAMYALFNPETGLFKDTGIKYDLNQQGNLVGYTVGKAGDAQTAQMFSELTEVIDNIWGVNYSKTIDSSRHSTPEPTPPPTEAPTPIVTVTPTPTTPVVTIAPTPTQTIINTPTPTGTPEEIPGGYQDSQGRWWNSYEEWYKYDPIYFQLGNDENTKYSFVIDRDSDGTFTGKNEFVGAESGTTWLEDLKSLDKDGDNKLTGDELKDLKIFSTSYTDDSGADDSNVHYDVDSAQTGSETYFRESTTNVQYGFMNAQTMGIEEIDLADLENMVNQSTGKKDVNNSEIFNDSFTFKMNGEEVTAHRQDETGKFMDAVYGAAYGKNFEIAVNDSEADELINQSYGEFDEFDRRYADMFADINIIRNVAQAKQQVSSEIDVALNRMDNYENVELIKAGNKAASFTNNAGWSTMQSKVAQIAAQEGITIDMEQAKGIYILDASLDAQAIVNKYKDNVAKEESVARDRALAREAWSAIIECAKNDVDASLQEINNLLKSGEANNAKEVAEILKERNGQNHEPDESLSTSTEALNNREDEIFNAFNRKFEAEGKSDKVVDALYELITEQMKHADFMPGKTSDELAERMLRRYR